MNWFLTMTACTEICTDINILPYLILTKLSCQSERTTGLISWKMSSLWQKIVQVMSNIKTKVLYMFLPHTTLEMSTSWMKCWRCMKRWVFENYFLKNLWIEKKKIYFQLDIHCQISKYVIEIAHIKFSVSSCFP